MSTYYNEIDRNAAAWLRELIKRNLIADGEVDERSISDVAPADLAHFTQCHFFAGIGVWSHALRLAGWSDDRPVWTGSCPCQPFSSAARGRNIRQKDERHLWPYWRRLIAECSPRTVIGEQVAAASDWFDGVCDDMEALDYSIGATILPVVAVGFDHARPRIYFVGHANGDRKPSRTINGETSWLSGHHSDTRSVGRTNGNTGRVAQLRAFGNTIVPQVAAEFIKAYMSL